MRCETLIVGSGPAAVSAATPLIKAGMRVVIVDPANRPSPPRSDSGTFKQIREDPDDTQWQDLLGADFGGIGAGDKATPKMKIPRLQYVQAGFAQSLGLRTDGIRATGSLATGGLSEMWGAGPFAYGREDLIGWPFGVEALEPSYRAVAERIGISGTTAADDDMAMFLGDIPLDPPLPLHPAADGILSRYNAKRSVVRGGGFTLGRTRNAVLTRDRDARKACTLDNMCLWGCSKGAIYSAAYDVDRLSRLSQVTRLAGFRVAALARESQGERPGWSVTCRALEGDDVRIIRAERVLLAAGAITSGVLAGRALGLEGEQLPVLSHPAMAFGFVVPRLLGRAGADEGYALGHLAYRAQLSADRHDYGFGVIFSAEGILASDLARQMPLSRPAAIAVTRMLLPAMLLANCYLTSDFAACRMVLRGDPVTGEILLSGTHASGFDEKAAALTRRVRHGMRMLGAHLLPGGAKVADLGSDGHFAGTVPMCQEGDAVGRPLSATPEGAVRQAPGLYVVDGAALPRLSAKHPTFTIMANADRIARCLVAS